eukprot:CAMPEP_0173378456 /NCGR_PEP_ID=MMETSP1356-20130122/1611_1 /TAXON_ID=77927 ORGANISM="Hemiselmis virescens, Strain PCC157" /NCGR_SAMPLE_ID=MMETSP1356 /ASSEMBLY_ACC=CAM_ASM_000847 /LENGTH=263 /DNA_ID=CAMNT_0014331529 /DNA_START=70 /DNA_END=858 /DNA_ORIENTATION=+
MSTHTTASDPAPQTIAKLPGYRFDMGHQETERLVDELEQICKTVKYSAGEAWMTAVSAQSILCTDLGYEDAAELEDAIRGSFEDFLKALPHIETKIQDDGSASHGKLVFRALPLKPLAERKMFLKKLTIATREDLWRVIHKAPCAVVEIPELEFEIGADSKRKIDSLYNLIASAVYNLSMHVSTLGNAISDDHKEKIGETVDELNKLLDVEKPWTLLLHDRTGLSEIRPEEGVETTEAGPAEEDPAEQNEREQQEAFEKAIAE